MIDDTYLKDKILHEMFLNLSQESLLDIFEILKGYKERINKSKKDTLLARCMFAYGYHNTMEYQSVINVTKDSKQIKALSNDISSIDTLNELRKAFNISNDTLEKIIKDLEKAGITLRK